MQNIKTFKKFLEQFEIDTNFQLIDDLKESLSMWHDVLLASIGAELTDIFDELKLSQETKLDIDEMANDVDFVNSLISLGLKKTQVEETDNYETFVNKPCKFMLIYDQNANELENPEYIIFQTWNTTLKQWEEAKLYKLTGNINDFYNKLTSRTIEIVDDNKNFIYTTSNGNDWQLQDPRQANDVYKRILRKEEFEEIIDKRGLKLNII